MTKRVDSTYTEHSYGYTLHLYNNPTFGNPINLIQHFITLKEAKKAATSLKEGYLRKGIRTKYNIRNNARNPNLRTN